MKTRTVLAVVSLLAALGGGTVGHGQGLPAGALIEELERIEAGTLARGISLDEAIDRVQRQYGARVVRAEVRESQGRTVYVLRLLSREGRVWTVRVDAQSGRTN